MALITVNFHPYKKTQRGESVLQALHRDPYLRSQYETKTSNGGLSAHEGGARWQWESRIFNKRYDQCQPEERPKYGAFNYLSQGSGASPRFGSAYFQLKPHVLERATFCYPDSYLEPDNFCKYAGIAKLIELVNQHSGDPLDKYIEAHMHGQVSLADDVESLVLDPIFRGSEIESQARQLPVDIHWHTGFRVEIDELEAHLDYRGEQFVILAKEVTKTFGNGRQLNCMVLADAEQSADYPAQDLKKVWHYLARFGDSFL